MKYRFEALIPGAMLLLALGLRIADPPAIQHLRLVAFDEYQRLKPRPWTDAGIAIVDVDDASLERLGQWPWPRTQIATLIERLGAMGAATVAFDIVFAEPDRTSPARIISLWGGPAGDPAVATLAERLPAHDAALATAMADTPTVLGMMLTDRITQRRPPVKWGLALAGDDPRPFLQSYSGAVTDLPLFEAAASGEGSFNSAIDRDGMIPRVPVLVRLAADNATDELYPPLPPQALHPTHCTP